MTSVVIRPARRADAPQVSAVFEHARATMTYLPSVHSAEQIRRFFAKVVREQQVYVAAVGRTVIGFAAVHDGWLEHLYLEPDWTGRGIGSALLRVAVGDLDGVQLWVFQENKGARRFYERHGFALVELTDGAANEEHQPDARYEWVSAAPVSPAGSASR